MVRPPDTSRRPRRFYQDVTVAAEGDGFVPRLDGKTPRTPGGRPLALPTRALAGLVAGEWRAQGDTLDHPSMPATRLAHTAIDVVAGARAASVEGVLRFGEADLICYFAEHPASLVQRQERVWGPLLDWTRDDLGLDFGRASGVVHRPQRPETLARLAALVEPLDTFSLAEGAMAASRLDEIFQEERWGVDAEAEAKADAMAVEAVMAERWFRALA
jgi:chaperone required for assembly of F1-ATPase